MIRIFTRLKTRLVKPSIYLQNGHFTMDGVEFDIQRDGIPEKLFFKSNDAELSNSVDVVALPSLLQAMKRKRSVIFKDPISPELVTNLKAYTDIYAGWHQQYHSVSLEPGQAYKGDLPPTNRTASFFSGGVDSFYTLLKHQDEITDLIFVHGFDLSLDEKELIETVSKVGRSVAAEFGVRFIEVETNARKVQKGWGHWGPHAHGLGLASVARLLSRSIDKVYIPSSFSQDDLFPWGTHPKTDYLLGDNNLEIVHDSVDLKRSEKTAYISQDDRVLKALRVCYKNTSGAYNCCECEKCLRTMTSLYAVNKLKECETFSKPLDIDLIKKLDLTSEVKKRFANETIEFLHENNLGTSELVDAWAR